MTSTWIFVQREGDKNIVVAVVYSSWEALNDGDETRNMQNESILKAGRKKYRMTGYFPPTPSDPVLRLVFPRTPTEADKNITFELYLPGKGPYHDAQFRIRDMTYKGKLEM
ncbi:MAG: hypothetical protein U0Q18_06120 [Bryobacteraceae bacterium]